MTVEEARALIAGVELADKPMHWADLGCGTGIFSYALAGLLPEGSSIVCMDKAPAVLQPSYSGVALHMELGNFENAAFHARSLDGILMANSLHYVADQPAFIEKLPVKSLIIVEYDTDTANPWVPYPVSFRRLQQLFTNFTARKLGERPSMYGRANLYACQLSR